MTIAPDISVLLPVFDGAATLAACLQSLERQSLSDWECILVDDGSTDDTGALARAAARSDSRIRVLEQPHRGLVAALNRGIEACTGRYVARMDADDLMHRHRLEHQAAALCADPALAAVGCRVRMFPRRAVGAGMRHYEQWLNAIDSPQRLRAEAYVECPIAHPTLMIRRPLLEELGYRDEGWPEDYDLFLRLLTVGHEMGVVPERLLSKAHGPQTFSQRHASYTQDRFTACKASFLAHSFLQAHPRYVLWGYGETGRTLARALRAHGKAPAAIVELHPGRIGNTIQGAPVVRPEDLDAWRGIPLIASVAGAGAREKIRGALDELGFRELRDYVCAA